MTCKLTDYKQLWRKEGKLVAMSTLWQLPIAGNNIISLWMTCKNNKKN